MKIDFKKILKINVVTIGGKDHTLFLYHNPKTYRIEDANFHNLILLNDVMHYRDTDKNDTEIGRSWAQTIIKLK